MANLKKIILFPDDFQGQWEMEANGGTIYFLPYQTVRQKLHSGDYSLDEEKVRLEEKFKADALKECNLTDHPEAERLWKLAQLSEGALDNRLEVLIRLERIANVWLTDVKK